MTAIGSRDWLWGSAGAVRHSDVLVRSFVTFAAGASRDRHAAHQGRRPPSRGVRRSTSRPGWTPGRARATHRELVRPERLV